MLRPLSPDWKSEMLPSALLLTTRLSRPVAGNGTAIADVGSIPPLESVWELAELDPRLEITVMLSEPELTVTRSWPDRRRNSRPRAESGRFPPQDYGRLVVEEAVAQPSQHPDLVGPAVGDQEVGHRLPGWGNDRGRDRSDARFEPGPGHE